MAKSFTEKEALETVKRWGGLLGDVPAKLRTLKVCLTAVKQSDYALKYVPKNLVEAALKKGAL